MQEPGSYQKSPAVSHEVGEAALQLAPANPRIAGWLEQAGNEAADAPGPESATVTGSPAHELRPKVRLLFAGAEALSSAELLALLFLCLSRHGRGAGAGACRAPALRTRRPSRPAPLLGPRAGRYRRGRRGQSGGPARRLRTRQAPGFGAHPAAPGYLKP